LFASNTHQRKPKGNLIYSCFFIFFIKSRNCLLPRLILTVTVLISLHTRHFTLTQTTFIFIFIIYRNSNLKRQRPQLSLTIKQPAFKSHNPPSSTSHIIQIGLILGIQYMSLPPPPPLQGDDPIITQFKPVEGQWELNDENITRIDSKTGSTILHNYCRYINITPIEVYRYLIETLGADVNAQDKDNNTPIHRALLCFNPNDGDITVLHYLLSQEGIDGNIKGQWSHTLLHTACININALPFDIFKVLIEKHGCDVNAQDKDKNTPLHHALGCFDSNKGGDITVLTYLLNQKGVNGNMKGYNGNTILHKACVNINSLPLDIFKLLIEIQGCDVKVRNTFIDTPIDYALYYFNPNNGGDISVLQYLFSQKDVHLNIKGQNHRTLLHKACENINKLPLDVFKFLIETMGCDINAQDNNSNTPLHDVLRDFDPNKGGDITVLAYLINQKIVDVNIKGYNGYTLLHRACIIYLSNTRYDMKKNAECDAISCQIVELIAERCIQEVLDEAT